VTRYFGRPSTHLKLEEIELDGVEGLRKTQEDLSGGNQGVCRDGTTAGLTRHGQQHHDDGVGEGGQSLPASMSMTARR
jgi:hypothetical protein